MKSDIFILERRWNICRKLNVVKKYTKKFRQTFKRIYNYENKKTCW